MCSRVPRVRALPLDANLTFEIVPVQFWLLSFLSSSDFSCLPLSPCLQTNCGLREKCLYPYLASTSGQTWLFDNLSRNAGFCGRSEIPSSAFAGEGPISTATLQPPITPFALVNALFVRLCL